MKSRIAILFALGALLAVLPTAAFGGASHRAVNSATFQDSVGEDASAPDITTVQVSNDDAGLITFKINVSNRPTFTPDMSFLIFLNTDQNTATGDTGSLGSDFAIELDPGAVELFQWNGSGFVPAASQTSLVYSYDPTGATIKVSAADLNRTRSLSFGAVALSGYALDANGNLDTTNVHQDNAPDVGHGFFSYQVLTKLVLSATAFTTSPKPARAGKPFSVSLAASENDTNGPVATGTVTCAATIAGTRAAASTHVVANGIATCIWKTPKTAKGKLIRGTITLTVQGVKLTRPFVAKLL